MRYNPEKYNIMIEQNIFTNKMSSFLFLPVKDFAQFN